MFPCATLLSPVKYIKCSYSIFQLLISYKNFFSYQNIIGLKYNGTGTLY